MNAFTVQLMTVPDPHLDRLRQIRSAFFKPRTPLSIVASEVLEIAMANPGALNAILGQHGQTADTLGKAPRELAAELMTCEP